MLRVMSPDRSDEDAIGLPLGDHAGDQSFAGLLVRSRRAEPFAFIT
jgi:hypothetical protein